MSSMGLRDELKSIEVGEAERATESVIERAKSQPDAFGEAARVLDRDYKGLLAIIAQYVRNTAEMHGADPKDVLEQHKDFISGMAAGIYAVKEIAENREMPDFGASDA